jgi:hypothetical protein
MQRPLSRFAQRLTDRGHFAQMLRPIINDVAGGPASEDPSDDAQRERNCMTVDHHHHSSWSNSFARARFEIEGYLHITFSEE